jgi:peptide deformylase
MSGLTIEKLPSHILRKRTSNVQKITQSERSILSEMAKTMYLNSGVGLAANQVGIDMQMAVVDTGEGLIKMINPVITRRSGSEVSEEGCLSVPDTQVRVKRASKITVSFLNEDGSACELKAEGLLARAIQHEVDHLSGRLIVDHLSPIKRFFLKKRRSSKKGEVRI